MICLSEQMALLPRKCSRSVEFDYAINLVAFNFRYRLLVSSHLGLTAGDFRFITPDACSPGKSGLRVGFFFFAFTQSSGNTECPQSILGLSRVLYFSNTLLLFLLLLYFMIQATNPIPSSYIRAIFRKFCLSLGVTLVHSAESLSVFFL